MHWVDINVDTIDGIGSDPGSGNTDHDGNDITDDDVNTDDDGSAPSSDNTKDDDSDITDDDGPVSSIDTDNAPSDVYVSIFNDDPRRLMNNNGEHNDNVTNDTIDSGIHSNIDVVHYGDGEFSPSFTGDLSKKIPSSKKKKQISTSSTAHSKKKKKKVPSSSMNKNDDDDNKTINPCDVCFRDDRRINNNEKAARDISVSLQLEKKIDNSNQGSNSSHTGGIDNDDSDTYGSSSVSDDIDIISSTYSSIEAT